MRLTITLLFSLQLPLQSAACIDAKKVNENLKKYSKLIKKLTIKNNKLKLKLKSINNMAKEIENIRYNTH